MQNYSFGKYKNTRDLHNEGWRDWLPWGQKAEPKTAARVLTPQQQLYQRPDMDNPRVSQPEPVTRPGGTRRPAQLAPMSQQPATAGTGGNNFGQKQRVGFGREDLNNVKTAIDTYLKMVSGFSMYLRDKIPSIPQNTRDQIFTSFKQMVSPIYQKLGSWRGKIDELIAQATAAKGQVREQYETILLEAIKISYKVFQEIQQDIMNMTNTVKQWANYISTKVNKRLGPGLLHAYQKFVYEKQGQLEQALMWMEKKLQKLMSIHNTPYQGLGNNGPMHTGYPQPDSAKQHLHRVAQAQQAKAKQRQQLSGLNQMRPVEWRLTLEQRQELLILSQQQPFEWAQF